MFHCVSPYFKSLFIGIQIGGCGDTTIRFRPALIFTEKHAHIVLDKMNEIAKNI